MDPAAASSIRQAISHDNYPQALELWNAYARGLRESLDRADLTEAGMREARELVEWSRLALRGARGQLQAQLNAAFSAGAYLPRRGAYTGLIRKSL